MSYNSSVSRRRLIGTLGAGLAAIALPKADAQSQPTMMAAAESAAAQQKVSVSTQGGRVQLKKFNVTVQRFDPSTTGPAEEFVLPVDCPDAEHAASAVLSNLIAWTPKIEAGKVLPIAFRCIAIRERAE